MSSKLLECWWTASFRAMYISFCSVLKLTNDFEITDWNYIQVLRGKYPIRVRKIVYVIHRLCWINLISETNLASNMLLYKDCEIFVENTPQVHSSMKASFLFDRFTNISKSKVSSIFPCKSPESLKKYRGRVKVGNIAHMVWFAHFLFTDSAYIAHAFQCINHIVLSDKCQCYEYPWCYKSPEDDNPIYRLVRRTTAFPGGRNSLLSAWSLVFVIETIVISVQNICRSMLIRVSICTYYFELWS